MMKTSGLLTEKPEVSGQVTFDMKFIVTFKLIESFHIFVFSAIILYQ